jgi:translation initiation factor 2 gamma subunit (eIF-2gamma)
MIGALVPLVSDLDPRLTQIEAMLAQILAEVGGVPPADPDVMRRLVIAATTGCVRR